jgi:hypothetical protein
MIYMQKAKFACKLNKGQFRALKFKESRIVLYLDNVSRESAVSILMVDETLKMKIRYSFETLVHIYQIIWQHIPSHMILTCKYINSECT